MTDEGSQAVQRIERPIAGHWAWRVPPFGLVVQWHREDDVFTAYRWVRRRRHTLLVCLGAGLEFDAAVARVREAGDPLEEIA